MVYLKVQKNYRAKLQNTPPAPTPKNTLLGVGGGGFKQGGRVKILPGDSKYPLPPLLKKKPSGRNGGVC